MVIDTIDIIQHEDITQWFSSCFIQHSPYQNMPDTTAVDLKVQITLFHNISLKTDLDNRDKLCFLRGTNRILNVMYDEFPHDKTRPLDRQNVTRTKLQLP
jgi:hypothetical protein